MYYMNFNKAFFAGVQEGKPRWRLIDAEGKVVGRLATMVADALRGKDKAEYTPHADCGDYVVIINADKVVFTGSKWENKEYIRYTGWIGGQKTTTAREMKEKAPERILMHAVKGMLPKNKLNRQIFKKLKVYAGAEHPHKAQVA